MSYEIKLYNPKDLSQRAYVYFNIDGKRIKEYNGGKINANIKPNLAKTVRKRTALLNDLYYAIKKALENGEYPLQKTSDNLLTTEYVLSEALKQKRLLKLNHNYLRNLERVYNDFIAFLSNEERIGDINTVLQSRIQEFLLKFNSSGTYYMNKRRDLAILFSQVSKHFGIQVPNVKETNRLKSKPSLHKIYTDEQLKNLLNYLKANHYNLFVCCLISYGCLLRPHREIRLLTKGHFKNSGSEIHLSAKENKSGRHRIVFVPEYVKQAVLPLIQDIGLEDNIFSKEAIPLNEAYFSTAFKRIHTKMAKLGLVEKGQTLYSFRHTSAISIYRATKNLHLLQQLMAHSDMVVTQKYLRGLGFHENEEIKQYIPDIPS